MSETVTDPAATVPGTAPAAEVPAKKSLEDSLAGLDEATRAFVLSEVTSARNEAKNLRGRLKEAEPILTQYQEAQEASKTELHRAQEEMARWQSEAEKWRTTSVSSRVERIAADAFTDPSDALSAVDPAKYLGAGGDIDEAAIRVDLDAVLERKPHWRKAEQAPAGPRLPAPNPAQGSGANGTTPHDPAQAFAAFLGGHLKR